MACPECYRTRSWKAFTFDNHILNVLSWKEITFSLQSLFLPSSKMQDRKQQHRGRRRCFPHRMGRMQCNLIWVTHCSAITSLHHKVQGSEWHPWEPGGEYKHTALTLQKGEFEPWCSSYQRLESRVVWKWTKPIWKGQWLFHGKLNHIYLHVLNKIEYSSLARIYRAGDTKIFQQISIYLQIKWLKTVTF